MRIRYDSDIEYFQMEKNSFLIRSPKYNGIYIYNKITKKLKKIGFSDGFSFSNEVRHYIANIYKDFLMSSSGERPLSIEEYIEGDRIPRLMLFVSAGCNLGCVYCHCNSIPTGGKMTWDTAKKAIDKYVNLIREKSLSNRLARVSFMGGGEPFLNFALIKKCVEYFKLLGYNCDINIVTNGVSGAIDDIKWCVDNNVSLNISSDGPPFIQDAQRPKAGGGKTSHIIEDRLSFLSKFNSRVHVRSTFLSVDTSYIDDIIKYYDKFSCIHSIQIEPLSPAGRAERLCVNDKFYFDFYEKYSIYLYSDPTRYNSSLFRPDNFSEGFCAAVYYNTIVTHDGYVSLCSEVDSRDIGGPSNKYVASHINDENPFFSEAAKAFSEEYRTSNRMECSSCVVQYKCGGGCYIKLDRDYKGDWKNFSNVYCKISKNLNISYLIGRYEERLNGIGN